MTPRFVLTGVVVALSLPLVAWSADAPQAAAPPAGPATVGSGPARTVPPGLASFGAGGFGQAGAAAGGRAQTLPAPLDGLAAQVAGVVGSGDKLSLVLKQGETSRTLKLGDEYQDGWRLTALSADVATLTKDGQARQIGLNPDGAIAQRDLAAASQVNTIGPPTLDPAVLQAMLQRLGTVSIPGLSAADSQQMMTQATAYMNTPAGQAAMNSAYQNAAAQYGQGAIDSFMAGQGQGAARGGAPAAPRAAATQN